MRRGGVEPVRHVTPIGGVKRGWLIAVALVLVVAGIGLGVYRSTRTTLEDRPPLRPLEPRELTAYLERDQVRVGEYQSMFVLPDQVEGWSGSANEIAKRMHGRVSPWSLEHPLPREVLTAEQTLAKMVSDEERAKLYPLELATALAAVLRQCGERAMVAEVWEIGGADAPSDPSGMLGYFVTAVYDESNGEEPSAYLDPWGGRGEISPSSVRVLRDTEVLAAALGIGATRTFARSGDGAVALPMVETALLLDPVSASLRVVNATILTESGGLAQAVQEIESAIQLRADGPRQLGLAQLHLAQAGMLEMTGAQEAAAAQFAEANRIVADVIEKWPRYGRAHVMLAVIHLGLKEPERARIELEAAEALSPDAPMLWAIWAQYQLTAGDPVAASTRMKRAVDLDPENWQLRLQAAHLFREAGDDTAAQQSVGTALELVGPKKESEVRKFVEQTMGPEMLGAGSASPGRPTLPEPPDPALMLGDPSKLRLRDPDETLKLDLEP
jgi:Tfp pilus assembly protein PilF